MENIVHTSYSSDADSGRVPFLPVLTDDCPSPSAGYTGCVMAPIATHDVVVLLTVRQGAAAGMTRLPFQPRMNTRRRINVVLNRAACTGPAKIVRVKGALRMHDIQLQRK